jgi:hypothetical protein
VTSGMTSKSSRGGLTRREPQAQVKEGRDLHWLTGSRSMTESKGATGRCDCNTGREQGDASAEKGGMQLPAGRQHEKNGAVSEARRGGSRATCLQEKRREQVGGAQRSQHRQGGGVRKVSHR